LQEDDLGKIAGIEGGPEVLDVVLMVRLVTGVANEGSGSWRQVVLVGRRRVILEGLMVRYVILLRFAIASGMGHAAIAEAALEEAPGDSFLVQEIADVLAGHGNRLASRAFVKGRLGVADHGSARQIAAGVPIYRRSPVGLAGDQIQRTWCGWPKVVPKELSFMAKC